MREYKFRVWHKLEKKYYEVWSIDFINKIVTLKTTTELLGGKWSDIRNVKFSDVILEQYTGLKDKNVYENDIVEFTYMSKKYQGAVKYNEYQMAFEIETKNFKVLMVEIESIDKVIGNIHEGVESDE